MLIPSILSDSSCVKCFDSDSLLRAFLTALLLLESKSPQTVVLNNKYNHIHNRITIKLYLDNSNYTFNPVTATIFPFCTLFTSL